jgi:S-formylglutathione hydrolase FrmB
MGSMSAIGAPTWLEGFGDWAWPGLKPAVEIGPAPWVPALPRRIEPPAVRLPLARPLPLGQRRTLPRSLRLARLAVLIAVGAGTLAFGSGLAGSPHAIVSTTVAAPLTLSPITDPFAVAPTRATPAPRLAEAALVGPELPLPAPVIVSSDAAGSAIASITFPSHALGWRDQYLVYLPPGYRASAMQRYAVLYLLHGDNQPARSFLRLGLQPTLDRLIRAHAIAPLIAVMLEGNGLTNNWRNTAGSRGRPGPQYNAYIGEVQQMTDRVLRTIPDRASRGIAGYSMGGFGAMNVALTQLRNYSVVESWEGFFNNLSGQLEADRPLLARLPLHAFVYGGSSDTVAATSQNAPWAAALRAEGAQAQSAIYPGTHSFTPLQQHLKQMLSFAGRALRS